MGFFDSFETQQYDAIRACMEKNSRKGWGPGKRVNFLHRILKYEYRMRLSFPEFFAPYMEGTAHSTIGRGREQLSCGCDA
jgi:hypothetical protein